MTQLDKKVVLVAINLLVIVVHQDHLALVLLEVLVVQVDHFHQEDNNIGLSCT